MGSMNEPTAAYCPKCEDVRAREHVVGCPRDLAIRKETGMGTFLARLRCTLASHDWEWGLPSGHSWCRRCKRYDDDQAILREDGVRAVLRKWSPLGLGVKRRDLNIRVGLPRIATLSARLHFGFDRTSELPGFNVTLHVWRLRIWLGLGSGSAMSRQYLLNE